MREEINRKIGNEIRLVQDDIRASVDEIKKEAQDVAQEAVDETVNYVRTQKRFLEQTVKNKANKFIKDEFGKDIDVDEVLGDIRETEELEAIANMEAEQMPFPSLVFRIALAIDLCDLLVAEVPFLMSVINVCFSIFLYFWLKGKLSRMFKMTSRGFFRGKKHKGKAARKLAGKKYGEAAAQRVGKRMANKYLQKYLMRKLIGQAIMGAIWLLQILAFQSFFVFLAWKRHNKFVRMWIITIEKIGSILEEKEEAEEKTLRELIDAEVL